MSILLCSGTVVFSITLEAINKVRLVKELADKGYRFDDIRQLYFREKLVLLSLIVPFVNLIVSMSNMLRKAVDFSFIEKLSSKYDIVPFTLKERQLYENDKGILTAIKLNTKSEIKPNMVLVYMHDECENIVYFVKEDNNNIITSVKGPISELSRRNQYKELEKQLNEIESVVNHKSELDSKKVSKSYEITEKEKLERIRLFLQKENDYVETKSKVYTKRYY